MSVQKKCRLLEALKVNLIGSGTQRVWSSCDTSFWVHFQFTARKLRAHSTTDFAHFILVVDFVVVVVIVRINRFK